MIAAGLPAVLRQVLIGAVALGGALGPAIETAAAEGADRSVWAGVYSETQAARGAAVYPGPCGRCHGARLNGAPDDPDMIPTRPIAGPKFLAEWDGRSLVSLFEYLRLTMPENNPGYLSDREYVDLIAYMLFRSGVPSGRSELLPDRTLLSAITLNVRP